MVSFPAILNYPNMDVKVHRTFKGEYLRMVHFILSPIADNLFSFVVPQRYLSVLFIDCISANSV